MPAGVPSALTAFVASIREQALAMAPAQGAPPPAADLAKLRAKVGKDLDTLEDLLEAFLLYPPPPDGA